MRVKNAMLVVAATALALFAFETQALDYHGYFRDTVGFNSKGGSQACFQLPGSNFKARLGNECERYLEFAFGEGGKFQNLEWRAEFMPASAQGFDSTTNGNNLFLQQMWLGVKSADWGGAQIWAGRRYFKRHDVHSLDWFYWNPAQGNAGAGVEDIALGFGKLAVSVFRIDASQSTNLLRGTYMVPELRLYDVAVNPNGTLEVGLDLGIARDQDKALNPGTPGVSNDPARAGTSPLITLQHNQGNLLGGSNTLAFQYGSGAFAKESGDGPGQLIPGGTSDDKQWRVIEHLVVNPVPEISGALVLVYQDVKNSSTSATADQNTGFSIMTGEIRPAYHFNDWFKFEVDLFYQSAKIKNAAGTNNGVAVPTGNATLMKLTAAPTLTLGRGYWARPVIRFFVTYASWNDNTVALGQVLGASPTAPVQVAGGAFGTSKNGTTFGINVETWF